MSNDKGKGEIEKKLDKFVAQSFWRFNLGPSDCMSKENSEILMKELMIKHMQGDAWDKQEFDEIFDLFEEDDNAGEGPSVPHGLDQGEFTKLVKRIAQL